MKKIAHKTLLHTIGWLSLVFGIAAMFIPLVPGFIFIAIGLYFLSLASAWLYAHIDVVKKRFPRFAAHYDRIDMKINRFIKKAH